CRSASRWYTCRACSPPTMALFHISALSHPPCVFILFFSNDPATTAIYTLSLHDALPISAKTDKSVRAACLFLLVHVEVSSRQQRSEEHTSELQSRFDLVCRLLLEKKKPNALVLF